MNSLIKSLAACLALTAGGAWAADHLDSPLVTTDRTADINDLYAFVNPNDAGELVLIATVFPIADASSRFSDAVEYRFSISNGAGGHEINCRALGKRAKGMRCALDGVESVAGPVGRVNSNDDGSLRLFAGLRDDPFYFDLVAFQQTVETLSPQFTDPGTDFFAPLGTLAIVLGVDSSLLTNDGADPVLRVWSSTNRASGAPLKGSATDGASNADQFDRMGRPAITTALINLLGTSPGLKDDYNLNADRSSWADAYADEIAFNAGALDTLDGVVGNVPFPPVALGSVLSDDRLIIDTRVPDCGAYLALEAGVPGQCGGRTLQADVIDVSFAVLVGPGVSDFVDDTNRYLADFPFLVEAP